MLCLNSVRETKGQTILKANYGVLNSSKNRTKLTILSIFFTQDSKFCSFFGRIEETMTCFQNLLTFAFQICLHTI